MSNQTHLAIAAVTATLTFVLHETLAQDNKDGMKIPGVTVSHLRPNDVKDLTNAGINIFLYQVTPNVAGRNTDAPTRRADGTFLQRPRVALVLHYLLSFYGDDKFFQPQILLASVVRALHANPILEREAINAAIAEAAKLGDPFIGDSDLAAAPDLVRLTPAALSLEELSKLWSVFFQVPYALSVAYQASVVFLDSPVADPVPVLPARTLQIVVGPQRRPVLERVLSRSPGLTDAVSGKPILAGDTLVLAGRDLAAATPPIVRFDSGDVPHSSTSANAVEVGLQSLRAGPHSVRLVYEGTFGNPPVKREGAESNTLLFVLQPSITVSKAAGSLEVGFSPRVAGAQSVVLLLDPIGVGAHTHRYRLQPGPRTEAEDASLTFSTAGVVAGSYLVRALVDAIESPSDPTRPVQIP